MSKSTTLDLVRIQKKKSGKETPEILRSWTMPVVRAIGQASPVRFNELKRRIKGISSTSLSERLSSLEESGIVQRVVIPETPPHVEYSLTAKGMELHTILVELSDWEDRWQEA